MALSCGSEVAEQITKKSVKVEISRRSKTTISSAFLFEASSAQILAKFFAVISLTPGKAFLGGSSLQRLLVRDSESIDLTQLSF